MAGYEPTDGRPILRDWMDRVRKETEPYYGEAHQILNKIAAKAKAAAKL